MVNPSFLFCLIFASICDLKSRIIPNLFPIVIVILALLNYPHTEILGGLIAVPFLASAMIDPKTVGGGDIKLTASIGLFLGFWQGLLAVILAMVSVIVVTFMTFILKKKEKFTKMTAPLAPHLTFGVVFSTML